MLAGLRRIPRTMAAAVSRATGTVTDRARFWGPLAEWRSRCRGPGCITLELVESRQTANLARREADMALRHQPPDTGDFYISKAGTFACAVYRRRGADAGAWVTYTEEQAHYEPARWVQRQIKETGQSVALRASSMLMHLEAIRAGTGRGVLP